MYFISQIHSPNGRGVSGCGIFPGQDPHGGIQHVTHLNLEFTFSYSKYYGGIQHVTHYTFKSVLDIMEGYNT